MSSLRARLIAVLLVVAAVGLLLLASATYAELRSYLLDRTDQQLASALPELEHQLDEDAGRPDGFRGRTERGPAAADRRSVTSSCRRARTASGAMRAGR